jgi:hypothetical protein
MHRVSLSRKSITASSRYRQVRPLQQDSKWVISSFMQGVTGKCYLLVLYILFVLLFVLCVPQQDRPMRAPVGRWSG